MLTEYADCKSGKRSDSYPVAIYVLSGREDWILPRKEIMPKLCYFLKIMLSWSPKLCYLDFKENKDHH